MTFSGVWHSSDSGHGRHTIRRDGDTVVDPGVGYHAWMPTVYGDLLTYHRTPTAVGDPGNPAVWLGGTLEVWAARASDGGNPHRVSGPLQGGHGEATDRGVLIFRGLSGGRVEIVTLNPTSGARVGAATSTVTGYALVDPAWTPRGGMRWVAKPEPQTRAAPKVSTIRGRYPDGSAWPDAAAPRLVVWNDPTPHPEDPEQTATLVTMPDGGWAGYVLNGGWFPRQVVAPVPKVLLGPFRWVRDLDSPTGWRLLFQRIDYDRERILTAEDAGWQAWSVCSDGTGLRRELRDPAGSVRFPTLATAA